MKIKDMELKFYANVFKLSFEPTKFDFFKSLFHFLNFFVFLKQALLEKCCMVFAKITQLSHATTTL